jgi:hypothetical protein
MSLRIVLRSAAGALLVCASAHAQSIPVTVVNTAAHPVPTTVTGTATVNVANIPSVTLEGVPAVNVASMPAVTLSGTPGVNVSNTPTVFVANQAGASGGLAYHEVLSVNISTGGAAAGAQGAAVPAGRRRVVTTVSGRYYCTVGHGALLQLFTGETSLFLAGTFTYSNGGSDVYGMVTQTNLVMEPGDRATPIIETDGNGANCIAEIYLSGFEVPRL